MPSALQAFLIGAPKLLGVLALSLLCLGGLFGKTVYLSESHDLIIHDKFLVYTVGSWIQNLLAINLVGALIGMVLLAYRRRGMPRQNTHRPWLSPLMLHFLHVVLLGVLFGSTWVRGHVPKYDPSLSAIFYGLISAYAATGALLSARTHRFVYAVLLACGLSLCALHVSLGKHAYSWAARAPEIRVPVEF